MSLDIKKSKIIYTFLLLSLSFFFLESCVNYNNRINIEIPNFNVLSTVTFEQNLSAYNIFEGNPQDLIPSADFHLLELNSVLFTDYAKKQRLVKVPQGTEITKIGNILEFPNETILAKTFYYYNDDRDTSLGKRVIETRLLIKKDDLWNVATYIWNEDQTEAIVSFDGANTPVNWITESGENRSTLYLIPNENDCIACHQSNDEVIPIGTTLKNLNREVSRNGTNINQLTHLQTVAILNQFDVAASPQMIDYNDLNIGLEQRARAYFDINCSHCHNPTAWEAPAKRDLDLRYEVPLNQTGIEQQADDINEFLTSGEMPFIGTTILDDEGVDLIIDFINSL